MSRYEYNDEDGPIGSDFEDETLVAKMARFVKGSEHKPRLNGSEALAIGQVFDNFNPFRRILENYAIQ